jgi:excisionase family DNA binding protein
MATRKRKAAKRATKRRTAKARKNESTIAAEATADANRVPLAIRGTTGLKRSATRISDEWHPKLRGTKAIKVFREMRDNDAVCGSVYYSMDTQIRQTEITIEAVDDSPLAMQARDHVESCLDDMHQTVSEFLSDSNSQIWAGWALHGTKYKIRRGENGGGTGLESLTSKHNDGLPGWDEFPIRAQDTIQEWEFRDDGRWLGAYQLAPPKYKREYLDFNKDELLLFRTVSNKNDPTGRSLFRNAWRSWWFLKRIQEIEAIGVEKDLVGMLVFTLPIDFFGDDADDDKKATVAAWREVGERARRGEHECIVMPAEEEEDGKTGFGARLLTGGGRRPIDVNEIIKRLESRIALSVLGEAVLLGMQGNVGSWSLASSKTHMFAVALKAVLKSTEDTINRHAIPRLIRYCGWPTEISPLCAFSDIESDDSSELAAALSGLVTSGLITADAPLEEYVRVRMGLPLNEEVSDGQAQDALGSMSEAEAAGIDQAGAAEAAVQAAIPIEEQEGSASSAISVDEAADMTGVNRSRLMSALRRRQLPGARIGNTWRIMREDLREYMRSGEIGTGPAPRPQTMDPTKPGAKPQQAGAPPQVAAPAVPPPKKPGDPTPIAGGAEEAKDITLNGAQIASLMEIIMSVAGRELPRANGIEMIMTAFQIEQAAAEKLMGQVGETFFSAAEMDGM